MVHPSVPAKNMKELVAWIKAQGKPVNFGSGGIGSIGHILGEMWKKETGLNIEHVGYKGSAPMITDLIGGTPELLVRHAPAERTAHQVRASCARSR